MESYEVHRRTAEHFMDGEPCILTSYWPYECEAKDKGDSLPIVCENHATWWTVPLDAISLVSIHRFDGGVWEFHAIDGPDDGEATHMLFAIDGA